MLINILGYIIGIAMVIIAILSAILICEKKAARIKEEELNITNEELKKAKENINFSDAVLKTYNQEKKENEEIKNNACNPNLNGHNAGIELLQKLSNKGKSRNNL